VGIRKASESDPLRKRRKTLDDIKTGVYERFRDESGGCPLIGQAVSGVKTARAWSAASTRNLEKHIPMVWPGSGVGCGLPKGARRAAETVSR
jgi:hypothetical protein